jgi:O-antigen/teichoic acid export membrane protein
MVNLGIRESLFWMGGSSLLGQIVTWVITIIVARLLTPADYGLVTLSGLFTVFAQIVSEMGVGAAVIQSDEISQPQAQSLYAYSLLMGVGMMVVGILLGAPLMAWIFNEPRLEGLVRFSSLVFFLVAIKSMPRNLLARECRFDSIAKVETVSRILTSFCVLGMALMGFGVWALAAQWLLIELFQAVAFVRIKRVLPCLNAKFVEISAMLTFGLHLVARNALYQLYNLSDSFVIGKLASPSFLGGYAFARQLTNMPFEKVLRIINQVLFPYFSRDKDDLSRIGDWTMKAIEMQLVILVPFFIVLFFCAREVVLVLLGEQWEIAVYPLQVLCVANIFKLSESYSTNILTALGKLKEQLVYVFLLFLSIGGGMVAVSLLYNVKIALLVWVTIYPVIIYFLSRFTLTSINMRPYDIWVQVRNIVFSLCLLTICLYLISINLAGQIWVTLAVKIITGTLVFASSLLLLDGEKVKIYFALFSRKNI